MKAISIKQPWASLIVHGVKNIENRSWRCPEKYIGERILIHASARPVVGGITALSLDQLKIAIENRFTEIPFNELPLSAIIGSVEITDCVINHPSIWAERGVYNWVLANPILFPTPILAKGKLSFWESDVEICHICGKPTCKDNLCERCEQYYCDD